MTPHGWLRRTSWPPSRPSSRHRTVTGATHASHLLDETDAAAVSEAIRDVVQAVRTARPLPPTLRRWLDECVLPAEAQGSWRLGELRSRTYAVGASPVLDGDRGHVAFSARNDYFPGWRRLVIDGRARLRGHTPPFHRAPPRGCGWRPSRASARRRQPARSSTRG
jgi:hypothetical protein